MLCSDGRVQVGCTRDTGDFRLVIADSNGHKYKKNAGSLEIPSNTGAWKGVEWRFFPHASTKFKRSKAAKYAMPTTIYTKSGSTDDFTFFSTKSVYRNYVHSTCSEYFEGNYGAPQNKDLEFTIEV